MCIPETLQTTNKRQAGQYTGENPGRASQTSTPVDEERMAQDMRHCAGHSPRIQRVLVLYSHGDLDLAITPIL